ncbi:MAG: MFS transporter [Gammaproteobacteria bacterium]|nr:MFS transporter [Gammaproteobacteria bacterium]
MSEPTPYPRPAYAWYCLGVICFAYLFGFMDRIIVGLLTPAIQKDIGLSDGQMGIIQGLAFAVFYTLFGLPLGRAADRSNRKWLLTAGTTLWSLMTAGAGLVRSFGGLFFMRAGVGVGEATLNPCATSLIGDYFRPESRAKAFGIYTMSTALGTGVTYLGGGLVIGFIGGPAGGNSFDMPLLGEIPAWQAVFILIGIAGLVPALLMALTIREPARRDLTRAAGEQASWAETRAFLRQNRTTLLCHHFGVAFILMAIYGWVNWLPTLFVRLHDWPVARFSIWYGIFGGTAGILSAIASGYVTGWFRKRGHRDGSMRTVLVGGIGLTLGTSIAPLLPTPELVLAGYCITGIFTNFPPAQALSAVAEITPNQLRGFVTSLYVFVIGIAGAGFGPWIMGMVTDQVFGDPMKIHYSIALVTLVMGVLGIALVSYGLKSFRESLARATWNGSVTG